MPSLFPELEQNSKLGQVWTPDFIAEKMIKIIMQYVPAKEHIQILDPACGPGTFISAFDSIGLCKDRIDFTCFDIDHRMMLKNSDVASKCDFMCASINCDYLSYFASKQKYDAVIMNPPYIRHELIEPGLKNNYYKYLEQEFKATLNKRSNMFVLFMLKSIVDLNAGGIICAIVYDAVCNSKYGKDAMRIINSHAELLFSEDVKAPFDDAMIDAKILVYKKRDAPLGLIDDDNSNIELPQNHVLLKSLLEIRRGTPLPYRDVFIALNGEPYYDDAEPFFIKQANLKRITVEPDSRAYLSVKKAGFSAWIDSKAKKQGVEIKNSAVKPIYGNILFNYYLRDNPRHLFNPELIPASDNFYVSSTLNFFPDKAAWLLLNSDLYISKIIAAGRNQGHGLTKLQAFEYKNVAVPDWTMLTSSDINGLMSAADELLYSADNYQSVRTRATELTRGMF